MPVERERQPDESSEPSPPESGVSDGFGVSPAFNVWVGCGVSSGSGVSSG